MTGTVANRTEFAPPAHSGTRGILVVDDEPAVVQLLDIALRQHGFTVWQANTGRQAIELYYLNHSAIDLVLLDVQMPDLDGPHTLSELQRSNPQVLCCFMSGSTGKYTLDDLFGFGAIRVLTKPFDLAEVVRTLQQLTSRAS